MVLLEFGYITLVGLPDRLDLFEFLAGIVAGTSFLLEFNLMPLLAKLAAGLGPDLPVDSPPQVSTL